MVKYRGIGVKYVLESWKCLMNSRAFVWFECEGLSQSIWIVLFIKFSIHHNSQYSYVRFNWFISMQPHKTIKIVKCISQTHGQFHPFEIAFSDSRLPRCTRQRNQRILCKISVSIRNCQTFRECSLSMSLWPYKIHTVKLIMININM